ncbi:hypothetical protein ACFSX9_07260 [Flavobacterium ardleyense]|uniref:Lipoprotein n=1 Tax=Flavobacterium ardleyense TaxID=2038737 RepID=A0ABW5Z7A4_9FLAO
MIIVFTIFINCLEKDTQESILDLQDYKPTLAEAVGRFYFVPIKDEFRDDYKYFGLKNGDTLFLEIKKDSNFTFNKFYYNRANNGVFYDKARLKNNLTGKLEIGNNSISISKNLNITDSQIFFSGFKKSEKTGLYYYYAINSPT